MKDIVKMANASIKKSVHQLPAQPKQNEVEQQPNIDIFSLVDIAKKYPRNIKLVIDNCINSIDHEFAQKCFYIVGDGKEKVMGPSVHLARLMSQFYGNMRVEARIKEIKERYLIAESICFDLESMYSTRIEVTKRLYTRNESQIILESNAAKAIAIRTSIFNVIPANLIDRIYEYCIEIVIGDLSTESKVLDKKNEIFEIFKLNYKIGENDILKYLKLNSSNFISKTDLIKLMGVLNSLNDGDIATSDIFVKVPDIFEKIKNNNID